MNGLSLAELTMMVVGDRLPIDESDDVYKRYVDRVPGGWIFWTEIWLGREVYTSGAVGGVFVKDE